MKINKWLYMSAALLVLAGCNDDWNEDKLDGFKRPEVTDIKKIEYTLLDADYKAIATNKTNKALAESLGLSDALSKLTNDKYYRMKFRHPNSCRPSCLILILQQMTSRLSK